MVELLTNEQRKVKRDELLSQLFQHHEVYSKISSNGGNLEPITGAIQQLLDDYMDILPLLSISRCPFTGDIVNMQIDIDGLDGLWWNFDAPKRPKTDLSITFFAMDGAMQLDNEVKIVPFLCSPGPEIPFVIPRLLSYIQVKAVLSTIKVGNHTGFIMIYFAEPMLEEVVRINDWGSGRYFDSFSTFNNTVTPGNYIEAESDELDYDFDLEPWIKSGKLMWIEPGDTTMTLKSVVSHCPYLHLVGNQNTQYIQMGEVWSDTWEEDIDSDLSGTTRSESKDDNEDDSEQLSLEEYLAILEEAGR